MNTTIEPTVIRQGRLTRKANKTDVAPDSWLVREWSDGTIEHYLTWGEKYRWVIYQGEHANEIAWEN